MNRRTAIRKIFIISGLSAISLSSYKVFESFWKVDLDHLDDMKYLIASLSDTIIPETNSPGSNSGDVDIFIIRMVKYCTSTKTQINFINGLDSLEKYCLKKYKKSFTNCTLAQKSNILTMLEQKENNFSGIWGKIYIKLFGRSFIYTLKKYSVKGYCTSMVGATKGLRYNQVPGKYLGCTSLKAEQMAWATH